jgi:iron complex outermembrane recepter protein
MKSSKACVAAGVCLLTAAQAAESQEPRLEEIVITAQKREQRLQDVALAVTAYSDAEVRNFGFREPVDVAALSPNVTSLNIHGNNTTNFVIRGIGLNDIAPNNSSPAAVHVDEVYYGFGVTLNFALFDIERVEVLRGPQGTLYGRNTTAGAVNFYSKRPADEFEASVRVGYGNYENLDFESVLNVPLSPAFSARLSGMVRRQSDGPWYNRFYDENHGEIEKYGLRAQLLFHPSEELDVLLNLHGGGDDSHLSDYSAAVTGNGMGGFCDAYFAGPLIGTEPGCVGFLGEVEPDTDPFTTAAGQLGRLDLEGRGATVTVNWENSLGTLTSISDGRRYERFVSEDADGFPQQIVDDYFQNEIEQYSQELRLTSETRPDALSWITGAYWGSESLIVPRHEAKSFFARNLGVNSIYEQFGRTWAAFVHGEYPVTPRVRVNAGARYTWEKRGFEGGTWLTRGDPNPNESPTIPTTRVAQRANEKTWTQTTGKIGLDFHVTDDVMLYGFVAKGFKSGGFNGNLAFADAGISQFDEEVLFDYEIGAKTSWLDGSVIWNTSAFYYDYEDVQLIGNFEIVGPGGLPANVFTLANLSDAEMKGVESELWWRGSGGLELRLSVGWLDAQVVNPKPGNEPLDDNELANSPEWSLGGLVKYERPVLDGSKAFVQLDFANKSDYFANVSNLPIIAIDGYTVANARVGFGAADGRWQVALWSRNLFDEEYATYAVDLASTRRALRHFGYPRTYGAEFVYHWR